MTKNILIVDDDVASLELSEGFLQMSHYGVFKATNGRKALQVLKKEKIDLVILDLAMPGMEGEDVLEKMAGNARWKKIPIIIDTAISPVNERLAKLKERFEGKLRVILLEKPFLPSKITEVIQEIFPPL